MKTFRKSMAFILALSMLMALCLPALADSSAESDREDNVLRYVSLGASNTNGYGLRGYLTEEMYANPMLSGAQTGTPGDISGYRRTPAGCYPELVKQYFESQGYTVELSQLAQSTMRVEELRFLIDESFPADEFTLWRFYDPDDPWTWWYSNLDELRADYKKSISEADVITYDMGMNNFGAYLAGRLLDHTYTNYLGNVIDSKYADKFYEIRGQLEAKILELDIIDDGILTKLDNILDSLAYALLGFCRNFDATMGIIRSWNDHAPIVVLNIQNVMEGMNISFSGIKIPFGPIFGAAIDIANTYTALLSPYKDQYLYADVAGRYGRVTYFIDELADYNGDPTTINQDMRDCMDVYDTTFPFYLRFRVAAQLAAAMGDPVGASAMTSKNVLKGNLPYLENFCLENCPELYERAKLSAYDVIMTFLQASLNVDPLPIDPFIDGADMGEVEDLLVEGVKAYIKTVVDTEMSGEGVTDEFIQEGLDELFSNDALKVVASFGIRFGIGNTFFSHPNRQGHRELRDMVVEALENNITGSRAFVANLDDAARKIMGYAIDFAAQFPELITTKLAASLGIDTELVSGMFDNLVDVDALKEYIYKEMGINDLSKLETLMNIVDSVSSELQKPISVFTRIKTKIASLFSSFSILDIFKGKTDSDSQPAEQIIEFPSLVIPKLTIVSAVKNALSGLFFR